MTRPNDPITLVPLAWPSDAELVMPGSKSVANRLLVAAALSGREVTITGVPASDDVRHMIAGLRTLGFLVQSDADAERTVVGPRRVDAPRHGELHCGNAGTALRFLVSVAAITPGDWTLTGDAAMRRRPIAPLVDAWRRLGADIQDTNGCAPVHVRGTDALLGGDVELDASTSSQFLSSLLLVGAALPQRIVVTCPGPIASPDYVTLTMALLWRFGVQSTSLADRQFTVASRYGNVPWEVAVDGDWSSMGVWTCLGHLTGSRVCARNLPTDSRQADERLAAVLREIPSAGEHTIHVAAIPDQFMNLAIVAAHRTGTTRITGAANLRGKESDRIAVMTRELRRLGADVDELRDGIVIRGGRPLRAATIDPANDHRIAMAFALAGLLSPGITIADPQCVTKSYPRFWQDLELVRAQRRCVAVIGMRGAGKSTFARAFAAATGSTLVDTDERFVAQHGPIGAFVARHGWAPFREHEERVVADALRAGATVATGGGAIESERTRALLRERAFTVWLDADEPLLRARLATGPHDRPSITGAPIADEVRELLARRNPLYAEVAHVRIDAASPAEAQVERALDTLGASCRWPRASTHA